MTIDTGARGFIGLVLQNAFHPGSIIVLLGVALSFLIGYVGYQLYFHPLAQYPGPFFARTTQWYDVYHSYLGDKHVLLYQLHQKYGTVVRFTPNTLSINDPVALKTIYSHGANARKSTFYECFRARPDAISTFLTTNPHDHLRKRRTMAQAFSDTSMRGLELHVSDHINDFVNRIRASITQTGSEKDGWSTAVDMSTWCSWLVFDIMGDLVFGRSFGTLGTKPENREGIRLLTRAAQRNYTCAAMPALISTKAEQYLPWLRDLYVDRTKYLQFGMKQVKERMREKADNKDQTEADRKDIFTYLLRAKDPETGQGFSMGDLWMEGNTLIVAGSDTTSTTLAAILHYTAQTPSILAKLTNEIRTTFPSRDAIHTGASLHSCTFLRACIDETMRVTPPVGGLPPREVMPGGLEIPSLGLALPAGTVVGVPVYGLHHNADYVVDPFVFDPERWFASDDVSDNKNHRHQDPEALRSVFHPFGIGHRACLGKPLVYMELSLAVARLLWEFDLRFAADQRPSGFVARDVRNGIRKAGEYHLLDFLMSRNEGPWLEVKPRKV